MEHTYIGHCDPAVSVRDCSAHLYKIPALLYISFVYYDSKKYARKYWISITAQIRESAERCFPIVNFSSDGFVNCDEFQGNISNDELKTKQKGIGSCGFGNETICKRRHCWEESNNYKMVIRGSWPVSKAEIAYGWNGREGWGGRRKV